MSQSYFWPPSDAGGAPVLPPNAATASNQVTQIGLETSTDASVASIDTKTPPLGQATMANSVPVVIASDQSDIPVTATSLPLPTGASTSALQDDGNATLVSIEANQTNGTQVTQITGTVPLPTDAATASNQVLEIAALDDIKTNTTGLATEATLQDVLTDTSSIATNTAVTTTAVDALAAKTAGAFVPEAFDYADITYVGATTDISTIVYKLGGSGGTTVATLTLGYDGSNRLNAVTKT